MKDEDEDIRTVQMLTFSASAEAAEASAEGAMIELWMNSRRRDIEYEGRTDSVVGKVQFSTKGPTLTSKESFKEKLW